MNKFARFFFAACVAVVWICIAPPVFAQNQITTVDTFFTSVSEAYAGLNDYSANITISASGGGSSEVMHGRVLYKRPNLLRIDFSFPAEQTLVFDGNLLTVYLPAPYNAVLTQSVDGSSSGGASLATPEGLSLMRRYYTIAYETGPEPVPLEEGSTVRVVALTLMRRSTSESFRSLRVLIDPNSKLIRRIEAQSVTGRNIVFTFSNYSLNQGISSNRFVYDSPSSANVYDNFLFTE